MSAPDFAVNSFNDIKKLADTMKTIDDTLHTGDDIAMAISVVLEAAAAIGCEPCAALGADYQGEIHPLVVDVEDVLDTVNQFLQQFIQAVQTIEDTASGLIQAAQAL